MASCWGLAGCLGWLGGWIVGSSALGALHFSTAAAKIQPVATLPADPLLLRMLFAPLINAGDPTETIPKLVKDTGAGLLVTDFAPLRLGRQWRDAVRGWVGGWVGRRCGCAGAVRCE